jgi:hypothetical protein
MEIYWLLNILLKGSTVQYRITMWNRNKWIKGGGKEECGSLEITKIINGKGKNQVFKVRGNKDMIITTLLCNEIRINKQKKREEP